MAGCRTHTRRSPAAPDVIMYRLEDKMMYVPLDYDWKEALSQARRAFESLAKVDDGRITFSMDVISDGRRRSIGISPSAWRSIASRLTRYEVINIVVRPEVVDPDVDVAPPLYSLASSAPEEKRSLSSSSLRLHPPASSTGSGSQGICKFGLKGILQALRKE
ncbi:hypothetical protein EDD16DRAFT_1189412 [Pisolithus croceorrhizus]|nr:hypothetical protein EDD16DRAFT_1189412 [Pisolithus croceorrhizus]KAI6116082.1 hypothetical protein F5141DRAFT_1100996 [Pisolithus sp. B1]KAI6125546.1 hypothetical protein EV401DRAFT_2068290 [Pisolithus croceorrhizus]